MARSRPYMNDLTLAAAAAERPRLGGLLRSNVFAWTVSLAVHAGLFLLCYKLGFGRAEASRTLIIPEARLAAPAVEPGPPRPAGPVRLAQAPASDAPAAGRAPRMDESLAILSVSAAGLAAPEVVSPGPAGLALPGVEVGPIGNGVSGGVAGGGAGGTTLGPVSRFFGQAGNAYKVVFVVDLSGSISYYLKDIVREMQQSIKDLVPTQEFHIVLAMPLHVREFDPRRLVPATARNKTAAYDFITANFRSPDAGEANPIEAMRRAFAVKPELIYFLSDGDYTAMEQDLLSELRRLNAKKETRITVIGFAPFLAPRELLKKIAEEHGGHCRLVELK